MTRNYQDKTAAVYRKLGEGYLARISRLHTPEIADFVKMLAKGGRILEVGCAGGRDLKNLMDAGLRVTGIDVVDEFVDYAKRECKGAHVLKMDTTKLSFPDETFDGVWANAVLLHLRDDDLVAALHEIHRVLKGNGTFFSSFKLGHGEAYIEDKLSEGSERYFNYFTVGEIKRLLKETGFRVDRLIIAEDDAGRTEVKWLRIFSKKL